MFIPDSRFGFFSITDSGFRIRILNTELTKNLGLLTLYNVTKLSQIWSEMFIPDHRSEHLSIPDPDPRVKKPLDPGPGFATLHLRTLSQNPEGVQWSSYLTYLLNSQSPCSMLFRSRERWGGLGNSMSNAANPKIKTLNFSKQQPKYRG